MDPDRFLTHSLQDVRITRILAAALDAVEPARLVKNHLEQMKFPEFSRLFLLGIGKAAEPMTRAAADLCEDFTEALVITKQASGSDRERVTVMESGHPIPDERSLSAGHVALNFASRLYEDDLLLCLISGGGSALVAAPQPGISLKQLQDLTTALLASGASIDEVNVVRRELDRIKGGGLAGACKAQVISLILSDVIGDHLESIASGPTALNPASHDDAVSILQKFKIPLPDFESVSKKSTEDTNFKHVQNVIIGNNRTALNAALRQAQVEGFHAEALKIKVHGEARQLGIQLANELGKASKTTPRPFCLVAGGETTVTLRGAGKGGRNQELGLAAVKELDGMKNVLLISCATDGDDGLTDAAGAVVSGETRQRGQKLGMTTADYLSRNDSYHFFAPLGDLLKPGYTGTNVNDLVFLIGL